MSVRKEKTNPGRCKPFQPSMGIGAGKERLTEAKFGR